MKKYVLIAASMLLVLGGLLVWWPAETDERTVGASGGSEASPGVSGGPAASETAMNGERLFQANCAACHGAKAVGTNQGPPLVHKIYEPGHHSDMAFQLAARNGVRAHHWTFGNMPPVPGVTPDEVAKIAAYVRGLQRDNGIY